MIVLHYAGADFEVTAEERDKLVRDVERALNDRAVDWCALTRGSGSLRLLVGLGIPVAISDRPGEPEEPAAGETVRRSGRERRGFVLP